MSVPDLEVLVPKHVYAMPNIPTPVGPIEVLDAIVLLVPIQVIYF
jgi:hypothetical protein